MNKAQLVQEISVDTNLSKRDIDRVITSMLEIVRDTLAQGEKVVLKGFGSFEVKVRHAYTARNPRSGEIVEVEESQIPVFKPSVSLKRFIK